MTRSKHSDSPGRTPDAARPVDQPEPEFPAQHQEQPGLEAELDPAPRWKGERYRPADKLKGMVALVTGGDSGIGRSVAYHFAREGADVAVVYLPEEEEDAEVVAAAIEELGQRCLRLPGDLRTKEECERVVADTVEELGRLDVLVHNAAWQSREAIDEIDDDDLVRTMETNVHAYLRLVRAAVPHMEPGASILATGSIVGLQGSDQLADYGATKGAIHSITRCLAKELQERKIRVNCVAPGPVWTPLNPADPGLERKEVARFGKDYAMGRPAQPEELAPAYVYLASNADSSYVTGIVLPVTGEPA
jgi:NAD(P)-dependent dehydrogenase (short-subunit alcohol dehydrogenase family)